MSTELGTGDRTYSVECVVSLLTMLITHAPGPDLCICRQLQLYSTMTTGDVIQGLLGKLRAMSPRSRFALYELDLASTRSRKLEDFEEPLVLVLLMGGVSQGRVLSLEDRHIEGNAWGVFASVELENFVRALDTEETRAVRTIEIEYERRKVRLKAAISKLKARPPVTL